MVGRLIRRPLPPVSDFIRTLLDDPDATTALATLGVVSGTYTPVLTNGANVAASTAFACQYLRVADRVIVSGYVEIDPTAAAGTATALGMSLPVASNFAAVAQLGGAGAGGSGANQSAAIFADVANDRASFSFAAQTTSNFGVTFSFMYTVA